jgi:DNA repair ATPase RecN
MTEPSAVPSEAAMREAFRTLFADEHEIPGAHDHPCLCTPVQLARALDRHAAAERQNYHDTQWRQLQECQAELKCVAAAQREKDAKIAENQEWGPALHFGQRIAAAIRSAK